MHNILSCLGALAFAVVLSTDIFPVASALNDTDVSAITRADEHTRRLMATAADNDLLKDARLLPIVKEYTGSRRQLDSLNMMIGQKALSEGYFVYFNVQAFHQLRLGDGFIITLTSLGRPYVATVRRITQLEGIRSFSGDIFSSEPGATGEFSVSATADGRYAAGNFDLSSSSYSLQARNDIAWIGDNKIFSHQGAACYARAEVSNTLVCR